MNDLFPPLEDAILDDIDLSSWVLDVESQMLTADGMDFLLPQSCMTFPDAFFSMVIDPIGMDISSSASVIPWTNEPTTHPQSHESRSSHTPSNNDASEGSVSLELSAKHDCSGCPRSFREKRDLRRHFRTVHDKIRVRCRACGKNFSRKDNLKRHAQKSCKRLNTSPTGRNKI
jgi:uncharacterized Zn-finger protein